MSSEIERFLNLAGPLFKPAADYIANGLRAAEEHLDPSAVILTAMRRSLQLDTYSCGLQSCHIILDYYGKAGAPGDLKRQLGTDEEGTGEDEILGHFRKTGLAVNVIPKGTLADIRHAIDSGAPMLACTIKKYDHSFVIYGYSESRIYMLDPSLKKLVRCSMLKKDFSRYWSGWLAAVYEKDSRYTDLTLSQNGGGAGLSISVKSKM